MKPPKPFKLIPTRGRGYSQCFACGKWKQGNNVFHHDRRHWVLCKIDYFDYWENTDELLPDFKAYTWME